MNIYISKNLIITNNAAIAKKSTYLILYIQLDVRYCVENILYVYINIKLTSLCKSRYMGNMSMRTLHVIKEIPQLVAFDVANDVCRCQSRVNLLTSSASYRYNLCYVHTHLD